MMKKNEAYLMFWSGLYKVLTYPGQELISQSRVGSKGPIYRARRKGFDVRIYGGMYEPSHVLKAFPKIAS